MASLASSKPFRKGKLEPAASASLEEISITPTHVAILTGTRFFP